MITAMGAQIGRPDHVDAFLAPYVALRCILLIELTLRAGGIRVADGSGDHPRPTERAESVADLIAGMAWSGGQSEAVERRTAEIVGIFDRLEHEVWKRLAWLLLCGLPPHPKWISDQSAPGESSLDG
jgi:hypothetical protein